MVMALGMLVNERLIRVGVGWPTARTNRARLGLRHCQKGGDSRGERRRRFCPNRQVSGAGITSCKRWRIPGSRLRCTMDLAIGRRSNASAVFPLAQELQTDYVGGQ